MVYPFWAIVQATRFVGWGTVQTLSGDLLQARIIGMCTVARGSYVGMAGGALGGDQITGLFCDARHDAVPKGGAVMR